MNGRADAVVIGAGIVGLATAWTLLQRRPGSHVVVLDKEDGPARHQTGRNSGVLHSGIYYKPGSAKARNCREGKAMMEAFCEQEGVPFERCGKVIVAIDEPELPRLEAILERGKANGVACERIGVERLHELEPHAAGIAAVHVPEAGIVSYGAVCERLAARIAEAGGQLRYGARVRGLRAHADGIVIETTAGEFDAAQVVNCAGLHTDRVAALAGNRPPARIVPFRGEYFLLSEEARGLCRNLIYPVPDPAFPFLGVHFTRRVDNSVECGPNAVLALAREGYTWGDINLRDLAGTFGYPGFWKLAAKHWRTGFGEVHRSLSKRAFAKALQRLVPEIRAEHLSPAPAGVRAQALLRDGGLVDDFLLQHEGRMLDVCNAPSPAATSALAIGATVAGKLLEPDISPVRPSWTG